MEPASQVQILMRLFMFHFLQIPLGKEDWVKQPVWEKENSESKQT